MAEIKFTDAQLEIYKAEVKAYWKWFSKITEDYDENQMKNLRGLLDDPEYDKCRIWTAEMRGMAKILNLTKDEVERIDEEAKKLLVN